jgi:hypothetical protein
MKRLALLLVLSVVALSAVSAEADTWLRPSSAEAQVGVGLYWHGFGQVQGGVDVGLVQIPFDPQFPLDLGVSGRVALASGGFGAGVYGVASYSWKALRTGQAWLDGLETYLGLGIGLAPSLGLDGLGGVEYHFNRHWALYVEGGQFGGALGGAYRF